MRLFEIIFLALVVISFASTFFFKRKMLILPSLTVVFALISITVEGFRIHIIPACIITLLLLAADVIKKCFPEIKAHKAVKIILLILLTPITLIAVTAPVLLFPVVNMPKPSGSYSVGTSYLSFINYSQKEQRHIPVQVWYPAAEGSKEEYAKWISDPKAMEYFTEYRGLPNLLGHLFMVKTNSRLNADILAGEEKYPVILFSGGGGMFNGQNVIQTEELASHGYIVFAVGHPYEDFVSVYPDGTLLPYSEEQKNRLSADQRQGIEIAKQSVADENSEDFIRIMLKNMPVNYESVKLWADDISFVIDKIEEMNDGKEPGSFKDRLDINSIGAFGHSFGGAASGQACLEDSRIKAFVNMDGSPFGDAPAEVINQPFMALTAGENSRITDGYSAGQTNYTEVSVLKAAHMNFTDLNSLIPVLGKLTGFLGDIPEKEQNEVTNTYLLAFFNKELKGQDSMDILTRNASVESGKVVIEIH